MKILLAVILASQQVKKANPIQRQTSEVSEQKRVQSQSVSRSNSSVSLYSILDSFQSVTDGMQLPFLLACALDLVAAFPVKAAMAASQWQHHAWTVPLHPPINTDHARLNRS